MVKIAWFILLAQASINFAAPTSDKCENTPVLSGDSENGSGDSCCERRCKEEYLGPGIYIHILHLCMFSRSTKAFHLELCHTYVWRHGELGYCKASIVCTIAIN